jgi:hypothetical protein
MTMRRGWLKNNAKQLGVLLVAIMIASAFLVIGILYGWWQAGVAVLAISIGATLAPILFSFLNFADLNDPGDWFNQVEFVVHGVTRARSSGL